MSRPPDTIAAALRCADLDPVDAFLLRRAAAYQAYYEHMPLPPGLNSGGPDMKIYGTHTMGNIARIQLLDMRQYRDYHVCSRKSRGGGGNQVDVNACPERLQPGRSAPRAGPTRTDRKCRRPQRRR